MLVFCLQYGVCRPDDRSSVTTKLHLLLGGKSVYVIGSKGRSISGHILRRCWSHFLSGLANICSLDIIWEAVRCLLATETPHIVHTSLSYRYFYSLDSGCHYFRACKSFILHDFSQTCHLFLDFIHLHAIVYPFRLQHRHLEEGSRAQ